MFVDLYGMAPRSAFIVIVSILYRPKHVHVVGGTPGRVWSQLAGPVAALRPIG